MQDEGLEYLMDPGQMLVSNSIFWHPGWGAVIVALS